MAEHYLEEISIPDQPPCLILLDLDGTLLPDLPGNLTIENAVKEKVAQLAKHHAVYLCTNGQDRQRARDIASQLGVGLIESAHKKYRRKIIGDLPLDPNRQTLVIGDKILTDGLLARRLGGRLYLVKSKRSGQERFLTRLANRFDDAIKFIISR